MKRPLPKGLAGQMIVVVVLALAAAQGVSIVLFVGAHEAYEQTLRARDIALKMESLVRLLATVPRSEWGNVLDAVNAERSQFRIGEQAAVASVAAITESHLMETLRRRLEPLGVDNLRILEEGPAELPPRPGPPPRPLGPPPRPLGPPSLELPTGSPDFRVRPPPHPYSPPPVSFATRVTVSALLPSEDWLNAEFYSEPSQGLWSTPSIVATVLTAVAIIGVVVVMVRRMSRPLSDLAAASEQLGRGQRAAPLPETGPDELRRTIRAFNTMSVRLRRFVEGQTKMLAAISHDLKTPITSLRIRTEFVEEGENRDKMLATLEDMQRITEATLAFARDDTAQEPSRTVDLAALVESVCTDLADIGAEVAFSDAETLPFTCKPNGLKRAIRNLVENAVKYGERARVAVELVPEAIRIAIDDDGPGIAAENHDRVFEPFVRLEESRSQETGGTGLGMSIARSIVEGHGGDIVLANRREGGLRVKITLPRDRSEGGRL